MPTAPTLSKFTYVEAAVANATNVTTASVSWSINDVVVVLCVTPGATGGETINNPTTTGSGITFGTATQKHNSTGTDCGVACWAVVATAASSGTFSFNATYSASTRPLALGVYIFTGSAGVGNSAIFNGATPNGCALTPTGADGAICWVVGDWAAAAVVGSSPTATTHSASSPGPSASPANNLYTPDMTVYVDELDDQTSTGSTNYGIASGTGPFSIIAVEVKAAAGGTDATVTFPQGVLIHP